jgi:hypothetical protein
MVGVVGAVLSCFVTLGALLCYLVCGCCFGSQGPRSLQPQQHSSEESDSDEEGGKLGRLQQPAAAQTKHGSKILDRNKLLQLPVENLSKWQRKRMREKAKKQQQQQQQH